MRKSTIRREHRTVARNERDEEGVGEKEEKRTPRKSFGDRLFGEEVNLGVCLFLGCPLLVPSVLSDGMRAYESFRRTTKRFSRDRHWSDLDRPAPAWTGFLLPCCVGVFQLHTASFQSHTA